MNSKISVIVPTYNRAEKVCCAIESALSQTYPPVEVVVIDDGSSDQTEATLRKAFGGHIRYYFQTNQGASAARNKGIATAEGEWIAFLDSDDAWEKDKLDRQVRVLQQFGGRCGACYTDVRFLNHPEIRTMFELAEASYRHVGETGVNEEVLRLLVRPGGAGMVVCPSSVLARADTVRKTGFNPSIRYSEDSDFLFRLALNTGFCYVNQPLVWFDRSPAEIRHTGVSADWNRAEFFLQHCQMRLEGLMSLGDGVPPPVKKAIREELRSIYSGWANWFLETGDYARARKAAWRAARTNLTVSVAVKVLLTCLSPQLALRTLRYRQEGKKASLI